uniref:Response regulator receiver protein n=1 Tax=Cyanothece sp. (strain PCC 7425 / ATCC 29141) TaxID=395961 RepID=B8HY08_CYAP4
MNQLQLQSTLAQRLAASSSPVDVLTKVASNQESSCLETVSQDITWYFYFGDGKLIYATHSIEPFDRLERHLHSLSQQFPTLTATVRSQLRSQFDDREHPAGSFSPNSNTSHPSRDYQALCWLVERQYIGTDAAESISKSLSLEVLESYLLLKQGRYRLLPCELPTHWSGFAPKFLIQEGQQRLQTWQTFSPKVYSPFQRPYLFSQTQPHSRLTPDQQQKLGSILRGFSFRHLAALLKQDELKLVKSLYPYILDGTVFLREPQPPFDQLPQITPEAVQLACQGIIERGSPLQPADSSPGFSVTNLIQRQFKIACIDDSPTILSEINRFLEDQTYKVFTINDSVKALMEVIRIQPDLVLLDIGMPMVDGYKLCRLIRNHSLFKLTPIVMVTGNTGIIDRAKAKLAGATDYMTKPFTQAELLKMVFRYLS